VSDDLSRLFAAGLVGDQVRRITARWQAMYVAWEAGEGCSPSATDLAEWAAYELGIDLAATLDWVPPVAELIYDRLCASDELAVIARRVVEAQ
jgi:hypothetical protein